MTEFNVSQAVMWIVVTGLCAVCTALARQIGVLHERIAPLGAMTLNHRIAGGDSAPQLTVRTLTGANLTVGVPAVAPAPHKSQLLFFLAPACPVCKTLLPVLKSVQQRERAWLDVVLVSDGEEVTSHQKFVERYHLTEFAYVLSQTLGMALGVSRVPYGVLIDEHGVITALGLVNTREHLESLFEAKRLEKSTLQAYLRAGTAPTGHVIPEKLAS